MSAQPFKQTLYDVIFGTNTPAGRRFDVLLINVIIASVLLIMIDSIPTLNKQYHSYFYLLEWLFTLLFLVEYLARLYCSPFRKAYIFSFYGIIDLLSILPSFIGLFIPGAQHLTILRLIRVLRVFRVLKLMRHVDEADTLMMAITRSRRKIFVFFTSVLITTVIFGSLLFVIEGPEHGFTSIPKSVYWAIVTITTVGYGDISPQTPLGQALASLIMITGYAIIAVPTGIITAELSQEIHIKRSHSMCPNCNRGGHESDAEYCKHCGSALNILRDKDDQ
ncbi:voltage-gated potassium channel [Sinobacterium caligoides]|uniref:Voltage-gated potassium channel n=1 Tax=Sinobacterium caligoides TaxID=933926 RepID=A0A3N2DMF2_9GAMM|nr:ion transporter [Sinobacterium caligoides]ROS00986.1 voltage-gated potassium channel [Sinobacterium caligoides]